MKKIKLFLSLALVVLTAAFNVSAAVYQEGDSAEIPYITYNYRHGDSSFPVTTKAIYNTETVLTSGNLEIDSFGELNDITVDENGYLYLLDGKNSHIVVIDSDYNCVKTITELSAENGEKITFDGARGLFVKKDKLYIADTENARVLVSDFSAKLLKTVLLPESNLIPEDFNYRPIKIAVDSRDYLYVLSDGSYYGALLYSPEDKFLGFYGANSVSAGITQFIRKLWENLTSTNEKRAVSSSRLPYQFTDLYADKDNFIYTATGKVPAMLQNGQIKRLSPGGKNILSSDSMVFGDLKIGTIDNKIFTQNIAGVAVDSRNFIYCYDISYGRIYVYNDDCYMLGAFGGGAGNGSQKGTFGQIAGIDIIDDGERIAVIDSNRLSVTVYRQTDFGAMLKEACFLMKNGEYEASVQIWLEILKQDAGSQLANMGLAKANIAVKDYRAAMKYAEAGLDKASYSQAFTYIRKDYMKENFNAFLITAVLLIGIAFAATVICRRKNIVILKNAAVREMLSAPLHPAAVFGDVKSKRHGSVIIGIFIMGAFYVSTIMKSTGSSFLFRTGSATFNSVIVLVQTVGFVLLWTVVNWAVATLLGGIGKIREIFIVITYSVLPLLIFNTLYTLLSYALNLTEGVFLSVLSAAALLLSIFMVIIGSVIVHDISFSRFLFITLITIIGVVIIIFLFVLVIVLVQETVGFFGTIIRELFFR